MATKDKSPPAELKTLYDGYLERRRMELNELQYALNNGHLDQIEDIAHRIKGNAGAYGYPELSSLAGQMEEAAISENTEKVHDIVLQYRKALES